MALAAVKKAAFRVLRPVLAARDAAELKRLELHAGADGRLMVSAIDRLRRLDNESSADLAAIDAERKRLLGIDTPLVDGSLGEPLPWDVGATIADACRDSKKPRPALLLYWLLREFRPKRVLEIGGNVGISAAYMAAALRANGDGGVVYTLDGSAYRQRIAKETISRLAMDEQVNFAFGEFGDILPSVLADCGPFDCAFIDGNHTLEPTLDFTRQVLDQADNDPLIIYDDIRWSDQMKQAWERLRTDKRMRSATDLYSVAVCRMTRENAAESHVTKPLLSVLYGPDPVLSA